MSAPSESTTSEPAPAGDLGDLPDRAAAAPTRGKGRRAGFVLAVSLSVLLGVATVVLALLLAAEGSDDEDDLRRTAGQFAEALVTYDYRAPEDHRDAVLAMATGSFREEYEDAFDQGLSKIITEVEAVSQGFVKDVYLSQVEGGQASAVVSVDIENDGAGGPRTLYDVYFRLTLVRVDDEWKIDQVIDLNFGGGGGAPAPEVTGGTTSTTTAPTTTSVP